jgi:hypothetical protein
MAQTRRRRTYWLLGSLVLLTLGVVIGLILQNVWLGLLLAAIVSVVWLVAAESRKGNNTGVNDETHGIEL